MVSTLVFSPASLPLSDFENFSGLSVTHPKSALPLFDGVVAVVRSEEGERGRAINGVCAAAFTAASTNTSYRNEKEGGTSWCVSVGKRVIMPNTFFRAPFNK